MSDLIERLRELAGNWTFVRRCDFEDAADTIESLQRENETQRRLRDEQSGYTIALQRLIEHFCGGRLDKFDREQAPHHYDMLSKAAAITPEMRERIADCIGIIEAIQRDMGREGWAGAKQDSCAAVGVALRDLLGEQG